MDTGFSINLTKSYCKEFLAYMKTFKLKDGDEVKGHDYINWITQKHSDYKKKIAIGRYSPYTKDQEKTFLDYING